MDILLVCLVVAIADGDTLTARCGELGYYEQVKIRIAGIDAPKKGNWNKKFPIEMVNKKERLEYTINKGGYWQE